MKRKLHRSPSRWVRAVMRWLWPMPPKNCGESMLRYWMNDLSNDDLRDVVVTLMHESRQSDWFPQYLVLDRDNKRLRNILGSDYRTQKDFGRAMHMADLELKVKRLQGEVRDKQEASERRNRQSFANGYIVHCTGCDAGAPPNHEELTEGRVKAVELIAVRLRTWWNNHQYRENRKQVASPIK